MPSCDFDGVGLVPVQQEALAECVVPALEPEHLRALRIERTGGDQVVDVSAWLEVRIELDERGGPEVARGVGRIDFAGDVFGADVGEASGKPFVLGDEFFAEGEYVHQLLLELDPAVLARASIAAHRSISASNGSFSSSSMPSASILA